MAQPEVQEQNSPAVVTFMTTEHFVLQTAGSAGVGGGDRWRRVAGGALRTAAGNLAGCRLWAVSPTVRCGGSAGPVTGVVFVLVVSAGLDALERRW
jgi:hypothetical protein